MNTIIQKKWFAWAMVFLFVLNISTLATIVFLSYQQKQYREPMPMDGQRYSGSGMIKQLHFDAAQEAAFSGKRDSFFRNTRPVMKALHQQRRELIYEIGRDNPDTVKLNNIADSIGYIQAGLKKETIRHFLSVRKACNAEQREALLKMYKESFFQEEGGKGMGKQYRHGRQENAGGRGQHRKGRSQGNDQ